ncbi:hypothetical protein EVAR_69779_1 [Eumeta japonica]|uniref:Uncharacterized protein n=1 Tax=Eumeta variegata TaxID=151549 RepID=A0A4C2A6P5_EUMVA|nr:hypothetical protein EVAR_69779_1 [Eumeta japonica]
MMYTSKRTDECVLQLRRKAYNLWKEFRIGSGKKSILSYNSCADRGIDRSPDPEITYSLLVPNSNLSPLHKRVTSLHGRTLDASAGPATRPQPEPPAGRVPCRVAHTHTDKRITKYVPIPMKLIAIDAEFAIRVVWVWREHCDPN